jgi:hypothetical protein
MPLEKLPIPVGTGDVDANSEFNLESLQTSPIEMILFLGQ